jgi:glycosyltransferase involved in cell wall biosynthesis
MDDSFKYLDDFVNKEGTQKLITERKKFFNELIPHELSSLINFNKASSIHIHGAYNFLPVYNSLKSLGLENNVIKILTTHNPCKPAMEDMELITKTISWKDADKATLKYFFDERDMWAYKLADAYIFPTEETVQCYYDTWPEFKNIVKKDRIFYCTTGSRTKEPRTSSAILRHQYNIPENAPLFVYIGRFVKVRGYETLMEFANLFLNQNKNAYVMIVGENAPANAPKSDRLIFVPFSLEPGSFIAAADACLIPSRENYFDLSMIEILSIGTPIIASYVGGLKYLEGRTNGVIYFEPQSAESMVKAANKLISTDAAVLRSMRENNVKLYHEELSLNQFFRNYNETISQIYDKVHLEAKKANIPFEIYDEFLSNPDEVKQPAIAKILPKTKEVTKPTLNTQPITDRERKLRKLKNSPGLYFKDFFLKKLGLK